MKHSSKSLPRLACLGAGLALVSLANLGCSGSRPGEGDEIGSEYAPINAITTFGSNPGALNMYTYVPAGLPANAPLVVAMHGCTQSASVYVDAGWNELADIWKFYVVYPEQPSAAANYCFDWYDTSSTTRGEGDALSIKQMVDYMKANFSVDASRVYVTGLSAGAAETAVMLATYPDVFAAGAIMSGLPYDCATSVSGAYTCMDGAVSKTPAAWGNLVRAAGPASYQGPYPKVSIWQGSSDAVVNTANMGELVSQWTNVNGISQTATTTSTVDGAAYAGYADSHGHTLVETYTIPNMGHGTAVRPGWSPANGCGTAAAYILSESICSTYYAATFFGLGSTSTSTSSSSSSSSSSGGSSSSSTSSSSSSSSTSSSSSSSSTSSSSSSSSSGATWTCQTFNGTNYDHVVAGRASLCGAYNGYTCADGSNQNMGLYTLIPTTLRETKPGYYEIGACP